MRLEKLCRAEQRGRVHIVATGMHAAIRRRKIDAGGFRNRQRIHVSTQKQARLPFAKLSNNAVAIHDRVKGHIHLGETASAQRRWSLADRGSAPASDAGHGARL